MLKATALGLALILATATGIDARPARSWRQSIANQTQSAVRAGDRARVEELSKAMLSEPLLSSKQMASVGRRRRGRRRRSQPVIINQTQSAVQVADQTQSGGGGGGSQNNSLGQGINQVQTVNINVRRRQPIIINQTQTAVQVGNQSQLGGGGSQSTQNNNLGQGISQSQTVNVNNISGGRRGRREGDLQGRGRDRRNR